MERLAYLTAGDKIEPEDLAFIMPMPSQAQPALVVESELTEATTQFQIQYIKAAIARTVAI